MNVYFSTADPRIFEKKQQISEYSQYLIQNNVEVALPLNTVKHMRSCEGNVLKLKCVNGYIIHIVAANYGNPKSERYVCNSNLDVRSCDVTNSQFEVQHVCEARNSCDIHATNNIIGDNCVGARKVLAVSATCKLPDARSNEIRREIDSLSAYYTPNAQIVTLPHETLKNLRSCQGYVFNLKCDDGWGIHIAAAWHKNPETEKYLCNTDDVANPTSCNGGDVSHAMRQQCQNKIGCEINTNDNSFAFYCHGGGWNFLPPKRKVFAVAATCKPANTVLQQQIKDYSQYLIANGDSVWLPLNSAGKNMRSCQPNLLKLRCAHGWQIAILSSWYGTPTTERYVCNTNNLNPTHCNNHATQGAATLNTLRQWCQNKAACDIKVNDIVFQPCSVTYVLRYNDYHMTSHDKVWNVVASKEACLDLCAAQNFVYCQFNGDVNTACAGGNQNHFNIAGFNGITLYIRDIEYKGYSIRSTDHHMGSYIKVWNVVSSKEHCLDLCAQNNFYYCQYNFAVNTACGGGYDGTLVPYLGIHVYVRAVATQKVLAVHATCVTK